MATLAEPTTMAELMTLVGPAKKPKSHRLRKGHRTAARARAVHGTLRTHVAKPKTVRVGKVRTILVHPPHSPHAIHLHSGKYKV